MKKKNTTLMRSHTTPGTIVKGTKSMGGSQPPKKRIEVMAHMSTMFMYSPTMKRRYGVEEYSTMKPATSSDSASGRSNGGRLVSARAEMKNSTNIGKSSGESTNQPRISGPCARTMPERLSVPAKRRTVIRMNPIDT